VTCWLEARILEQEEVAIARPWCGNDLSTATNQHAIIEELLEVVFSVWFAVRQYSKDQREKLMRWGQSRRLIRKLQASSGSTWLAVRSLHC
jgi:hypothetical protein